MPHETILAATQTDGLAYKRAHPNLPLDVVIASHPTQVQGLTIARVHETAAASTGRHYSELVRKIRARMAVSV